jgi:hypothetical protein
METTKRRAARSLLTAALLLSVSTAPSALAGDARTFEPARGASRLEPPPRGRFVAPSRDGEASCLLRSLSLVPGRETIGSVPPALTVDLAPFALPLGGDGEHTLELALGPVIGIAFQPGTYALHAGFGIGARLRFRL